MNNELLRLILKRMYHNRRTTILRITLMTISFSAAILLSAAGESISYSNQQNRFDLYGEWNKAVLNVRNGDESLPYGKAVCYGAVSDYGGMNLETLSGIGTVDENLRKTGRLHLEKGTWPKNEHEMVVEADLLSSFGCSQDLNQEITLPLVIQTENYGMTFFSETYILVGIVGEYTDLWDTEGALLPSCIITEKGAQRLLDDFHKRTDEHQPQYYGTLVHYFLNTENAENLEMQVQDHPYVNPVFHADGITVEENDYAYRQKDALEQSALFPLFICAIVILSTLCADILQMKRNVHDMGLFRCIGISERQLHRMTGYGALIEVISAAIFGIILGSFSTWLLLKVFMKNMNHIYIRIPVKQILILLLAWLLGILFAKETALTIALHQSLSGSVRMNASDNRKLQRMSHVMIYVLTAVASAMILLGIPGVEKNVRKLQGLNDEAVYTISLKDPQSEKLNSRSLQSLSQIRNLSGTIAFAEWHVTADLNGETVSASLLGLSPQAIRNDIDLEQYGISEDDFRSGKTILLLNSSDSTESMGISYVLYGSNPDRVSEGHLQDELASVSCRAVRVRSKDMQKYRVNDCVFLTSYDAMSSIAAKIPSGYIYGGFYSSDKAMGYSDARMYGSVSALNDDTDRRIMEWGKTSGVGIKNTRGTRDRQYTETIQETVSLLCICLGVAVIAYILLWNLRTLEALDHARDYAILQAVGMSEKQFRDRWLEKLFLQGIAGILPGALFSLILYGELSFVLLFAIICSILIPVAVQYQTRMKILHEDLLERIAAYE